VQVALNARLAGCNAHARARLGQLERLEQTTVMLAFRRTGPDTSALGFSIDAMSSPVRIAR
jgi:hypothetical protein